MKYLASIIVGLLFGYYAHFNIGPSLSFVKFIFITVIFCSLVYYIKRKNIFLKNILLIVIVFGISFCFGFSYINIKDTQSIGQKNFTDTLIVKDISSNLESSRVILYSKSLDKNILLNLYSYQNIDLIPGDMVDISGDLESEKVIYPKREDNDWESFDYSRYLRSKSVDYILYPNSLSKNVTHETSVNRWTYRIRSYFYDQLKTVMPNENAGVVLAMTLGDDRGVVENIKDSFRASGLSHVLVFSGFNFSVLVGAISVLALSFNKKTKVIFSIFVSFLIFILAPTSAPTARAGVFVFYSLLAQIFNKSYNVKFIFYVFILGYTLLNPIGAIYNSSFHLSVMAVGTIIYGDILISLITKNVVKQYFLMIFFIFISTTPYIAYTFGGVSLFSIFSNALSLPIVSLITVLGIITILVSCVSTILGSVLGYVLNIFVEILLYVSKVFAISLNTININMSFIVLYYLFGILLYNFLLFHFKKHSNSNEN